jgi:hypothetical protein
MRSIGDVAPASLTNAQHVLVPEEEHQPRELLLDSMARSIRPQERPFFAPARGKTMRASPKLAIDCNGPQLADGLRRMPPRMRSENRHFGHNLPAAV